MAKHSTVITENREIERPAGLISRIAAIIDAEVEASSTPKYRAPGTIKARRLDAFNQIWTLVDEHTTRIRCKCGDGSCMLCDDNGMVPVPKRCGNCGRNLDDDSTCRGGCGRRDADGNNLDTPSRGER